MAAVRLQKGFHSSTELPQPAKPFRPPASAAPLPRADKKAGESYVRPFGNERANSRLDRNLAAGKWHARWSKAFDPEYPPRFVLQAGGRVMTHASVWHFLDLDGKEIASGGNGGGPMSIEVATQTFTRFDASARMHQLSDGKELFEFEPAMAGAWPRVVAVRHGRLFLSVGWEAPRGPHEPAQSIVDVIDLGQPVVIEDRFAISATSPGVLYISYPAARVAVAGDTVVAAMAGGLFLFNFSDLTPRDSFAADFEPISLSLDEAGRIYLCAQIGDRAELWLLTPTGERLYTFVIPSKGPVAIDPPTIGFDHTAYIVVNNHIYAVAPDGKLQWSRAGHGRIGGTTVTPNDTLLVSEGNEVASYDTKGKKAVLATLPGPPLLTPPVVTERDELLVASEAKVYCLHAKP